MTLFAVAAITTGCPSPELPPVPSEDEITAVFTEAVYEYHFDAFENGTGNFGFTLLDRAGDGVTELYVDIVSDNFDDYMEALPVAGTYNFAKSHDKFTITEDSYFYSASDGSEMDLSITGGTFTFARTGAMHTIAVTLELDNGKVLKSNFKGEIYPFFGGREEIEAEFNEMEYSGAEAYKIPGHDGMWQFLLEGEPDDYSEVEVCLTINSDPDLPGFPTGEFPMAARVRQGIPGTAEPSSMYYDDIDFYGCMYNYYTDSSDFSYGLWAIPGEGYVNISEYVPFPTPDGYAPPVGHEIVFSFTLPTGKTVSGSYTGLVFQVDAERSALSRHVLRSKR
jgi:peptidoglycan hydrolase-like protein with peptidoglycan-binding domain